jgi:hypothetical protein
MKDYWNSYCEWESSKNSCLAQEFLEPVLWTMMNISVLNISRIDDLTIHKHLCSQHYCHFSTIPTRNMVDTSLYDPCCILPEHGRCFGTRSARHSLRDSNNVDVSAHTILGTFDYWSYYCDSWRPTFLMRKSSYEFTSESFPSSSFRKTYHTARSSMANTMTVKEGIL